MMTMMRRAETVMQPHSAPQANSFAFEEVRYYAYFSFFTPQGQMQRKWAT